MAEHQRHFAYVDGRVERRRLWRRDAISKRLKTASSTLGAYGRKNGRQQHSLRHGRGSNVVGMAGKRRGVTAARQKKKKKAYISWRRTCARREQRSGGGTAAALEAAGWAAWQAASLNGGGRHRHI